MEPGSGLALHNVLAPPPHTHYVESFTLKHDQPHRFPAGALGFEIGAGRCRCSSRWRTSVPSSPGIFRALFNSMFICVTTVTFGVFVNSLAGFAFAVFEFPFKRALFAVVLLSFMMPFEAIVIPLYTLMRGLGWTDTYAALILPEVAGGLVIFLFRQFFAGIPKEIYEAARLDGATWWQVYRRMTMPLSGPTIATASLILFIHQWDAFFWPLVAASSEKFAVVQVAIARNMTLEQANWGALFASASSAVLVAMVPFLLLQRYYIRVVATQAER